MVRDSRHHEESGLPRVETLVQPICAFHIGLPLLATVLPGAASSVLLVWRLVAHAGRQPRLDGRRTGQCASVQCDQNPLARAAFASVKSPADALVVCLARLAVRAGWGSVLVADGCSRARSRDRVPRGRATESASSITR